MAAIGSAAAFLTACPSEPKPAPKPPPPKTAEKPVPPPTPKVTADPACFSPWSSTGTPANQTIGARSFTRTGTLLEETSKDDDTKAVLGVVSDIKEDMPENLANLDKIIEWFKANKVDTILVTGDTGEEPAQIEHSLDKIAATGLPVFVIIGNREGKTAYNTALGAVSKRFPNVVNLNQARLIRMDDVAIVSLPGYFNKTYIHSEDGCLYGPDDVEATKAVVAAAKDKTIVLVSHGPPHQTGLEALDRTRDQENVGDPAMAALIKDTGIKFGVFGNIHEAGGRATDLSGTKLVAAKTPVEELFMNPGPADSVRWPLNDGTESVGMAGLMLVDGKTASFEIFRIKPKA
ncbi:MAG: metallophosphoesterase [Deltaproteobacteria bacterium]|nr:metallophosphoesterase [Deltaproteobacteria bacterium]